MRKNTFVYSIIFLFVAFGCFSSCDDDDNEYSLEKYYQSIVVVEGNEGSSASSGSYWLRLANGDLLWPVNQNWLPVYGSEIGTRGLATYNLVGGADGQFANLIRLIGISGILTKDIVDLTQQNADTAVLKNWNPGVVCDAWVEKSDSVYINIIFEYKAKKNVIHYINLVQDQLHSTAPNPTAGVWTLQLCQNANGDETDKGSVYRMLVSFYVPEDIDLSVLNKIDIRYVDWKSTELNKIYTIDLKQGTKASFSDKVQKDIPAGCEMVR